MGHGRGARTQPLKSGGKTRETGSTTNFSAPMTFGASSATGAMNSMTPMGQSPFGLETNAWKSFSRLNGSANAGYCSDDGDPTWSALVRVGHQAQDVVLKPEAIPDLSETDQFDQAQLDRDRGARMSLG